MEHNELCLCIASKPLITEEAEHATRQAFPDFGRYFAKGQIEIISYADWYLKDGRFDEHHGVQSWIDKLEQALRKGLPGVRFAVYEEKLEKRLHGGLGWTCGQSICYVLAYNSAANSG